MRKYSSLSPQYWAFRTSPTALVVKSLPASAGDLREVDLIPGLGRSPGEGNGHPVQYSCLGNPKERRAWWSMVHRVTKSRTQLEWLSRHTHTEPSVLAIIHYSEVLLSLFVNEERQYLEKSVKLLILVSIETKNFYNWYIILML